MILLANLFARVVGAILLVPHDVIEQELPMMAPIPTSYQKWKNRQWIDSILKECWDDAEGFQIQPHDEWLVNSGSILDDSAKNSFRPSTYGEITITGARQLFHHMGFLQQKYNSRNMLEPLVFVDWGSGTGRLAAQASLEVSSLTRAVGIELSTSRHKAALRFRENMMERIRSESSSSSNDNYQGCHFDLRQGDLFDEDTSEATHVYLSSLCFTPEMMFQIEEKIQTHDRLQCLATLRKLPTLKKTPEVHYVEMSWSQPRGVAVYIYFFEKKVA